MKLSNLKSRQSTSGFTIVELLIVIVVIGILAAIIIVAYAGVTKQANASAAKSNAEGVQKVAETYSSDTGAGNGSYATLAQINTYSGTSRIPTGVLVNSAVLTSSQADGKTIQYVPKGTTGACIGYWDANAGAPAWVFAGNAAAATNVPACT